MAELRFDRANEYSYKAFRRGATKEILETGPTLAVIITSGQWAAAGYRAYLDLQLYDALNISPLLIESIGIDSDETDDEPPATIGRLRKRRRHILKATQQVDRPEKQNSRKARYTLGSSAVGIPVLYPDIRSDIARETYFRKI